MRTTFILLITWCFAVASAHATVSFDVAVDRLDDSAGSPVSSGALVVLVADTNGDGLGGASPGSLALNAPLDGLGGDDLIIYRTDVSGLGVNGALGVSTGGLDLGGVGSAQWSEGDPLYLVWFPNLTLSSPALGASEPYGAREVGQTPSDGGNEILVYVAPTNTATFGSPAVPANASNLRASLTSGTFFSPPLVTGPTAVSITETSANLGGNVIDGFGGVISSRGVVYSVVSVNANPEIGGTGVSVSSTGGDLGVFSVGVGGLTGGLTYAFKAFAANEGGAGYSASGVFTTDTRLTLVGGLASIARDMLPGDRHRFQFTLDGARLTDLSTGGVPLRARLFNSVGELILEQTTEGAFSFTNMVLPAGNYTLELFREPNPGGAEAFTLSIDASRVPTPRPDGAVGTSLTSLAGSGVYSPVVQELILSSRDGRTVSGYATMTNQGNLSDRISFRGSAGNTDFRVVYLDEAGANVTAQVVAGSYQTPEMAPLAAARWVNAEVTPTKRAVLLRRSYTVSIDGTSERDAGIKDTVSIRVNTR